MIDNGSRGHLVIAGVCDGACGIQGAKLAFRRNRAGKQPEQAKGGILDGKPILLLTVVKDEVGPFYTARFEVLK